MKKKILYVVAEAVPFVKAGGVADVAGALPSVLKKRGYDVRVVLPFYQQIKKGGFELEKIAGEVTEKVNNKNYKFEIWQAKSYEGVKVYFVANHKLFGSRKRVYGYKDDNLRFYMLDRVALHLPHLLSWMPDVIHCNDWHSGLIPFFLKYDNSFGYLQDSATLYTIHNLSYQNAIVPEYWQKYGGDDGQSVIESKISTVRKLNFAKRAILYADQINAVSKQYAEEILTEEFGMGLDKILLRRKKRLTGILNGIDYFLFDPATDKGLAVNYDENSIDKKADNKVYLQRNFGLPENKKIPLMGIVSRLVGHKGFDLMSRVVKILLKMPVQIVIVGNGEKQYVELFKKLAKKYPDKLAAHLEFSVEVASMIYAGSDMFLMPSKFEPCGLSQLIALRYGSIPIVHEVGGLADTIRDYDPITKTGNGFVFNNYHEISFYGAIVRALEYYKNKDIWTPMIKNAMQQRFSWETAADDYEKSYAKAISNKQKE